MTMRSDLAWVFRDSMSALGVGVAAVEARGFAFERFCFISDTRLRSLVFKLGVFIGLDEAELFVFAAFSAYRLSRSVMVPSGLATLSQHAVDVLIWVV